MMRDTMMPPRSALRSALVATAVLLALPLGGCISLGPKTPPTLMSLAPAAPIPAGAARLSDEKSAIAVAVPTVQPALATQRVMVEAGPNSVAYLKDAQWVAAPGQLFRDLLAETITAKTGRIVPDPRVLAVQPDTRLTGHLVRFGLDGPGMAVVVTFDGAIARSGKPVIETRRFTARAPVGVADGPSVAAAMNVAANDAAGQVADWIGGR